jgi:hypothetical protein
MIDSDEQIAYSTAYQDPGLLKLDLTDWSQENERSGDWIHEPTGTRIGMTGRMGRWVIQYPNGRYHKTPGSNRPSYFAKLSKAIVIAMNRLNEDEVSDIKRLAGLETG